MVRTISLALWGEVGPLGLGEGELACGFVWPFVLVRVSCTVVVGIGALVVGQSIYESEFPPSTASAVPLPPRGTAFGLCFLSAWRIIDIKKAPTPLCGCLIGNLYVPKDTAYSVGRQSRLRLSKKVAERRPFSYIIDMGDALC